MNLARGFRRIGYVFLALCWAGALAAMYDIRPDKQREIFLGMLAFSAACVALYLALAWIVRGFSKS